MSDPYHTCYVLSGLSSAQHKWVLIDHPPAVDEATGLPVYAAAAWQASPFVFGAARGSINSGDAVQVFDEQDRVQTVHPVYTIAADRVEEIQAYFRAKAGF